MNIFHVRGPLSPESPLFKGRQSDLDKLMRWCGGEIRHYGILFGARQSGKTSLFLRLEQRLAVSHLVCRMDLEYLSDATPARVFEALAGQFARTFGEPAPGAEVSDSLSFCEYLCRVFEAHPAQRVVLLLEELGALTKSSRFALANALRAMFNERWTARRALARLMVIAAGNTELYDLAHTDVSPFANICEAHYLGDLSEQETFSLIVEGLSMLGIAPDVSTPLGSCIYQHTQGYPYLVQRLGQALENAYEAGQALGNETLEQAVTDLVCCGDALIEHMRKALIERNLMPDAQSALTEKLRFSRHEEALARLELIGLVRPESGYWQVRNPLFARAAQSWLADTGRSQQSALHGGLVRIFDQDNLPVGAGFLLSDRRVVTCGHVIAAALGFDDNLPLDGEVCLDFPLLPKNTPMRARIAHIQTYQDGKVDDIAILELLAEPPDGALALSFTRSMPQWGQAFRVCGFPSGRGDGTWADGVVRERISDGRFQLVGAKSTGYAIQRGFSGSPVWDETAGGVLGMIVAVDTDKDVKAAFMIPARELENALK